MALSCRFAVDAVAPVDIEANLVNPGKGLVIRSPEIDYIECLGVDIWTPDGQTQLVANLSFKISKGEHLLVSGMNGTGKSSLFRCMGDLWELSKGSTSAIGF